MLQQNTLNIDRTTLRQSTKPGATRSADAAQSAKSSPGAGYFPVLLTDEQSAACLGVSVRKFHELRAETWMPRPVVLGPRLLRWPRAELEQAVAAMPRQETAGSEPAHLRRAKIESLKARGVPA